MGSRNLGQTFMRDSVCTLTCRSHILKRARAPHAASEGPPPSLPLVGPQRRHRRRHRRRRRRTFTLSKTQSYTRWDTWEKMCLRCVWSPKASVLMQRLSYPTETVLFNKITRNRTVLSFKDSPRKPLGRRPLETCGSPS